MSARVPSGGDGLDRCTISQPGAVISGVKLLIFAGAMCLGLSAVARSQVLEIGDDGEVKTYDGPTVFTADGATPIDDQGR